MHACVESVENPNTVTNGKENCIFLSAVLWGAVYPQTDRVTMKSTQDAISLYNWKCRENAWEWPHTKNMCKMQLSLGGVMNKKISHLWSLHRMGEIKHYQCSYILHLGLSTATRKLLCPSLFQAPTLNSGEMVILKYFFSFSFFNQCIPNNVRFCWFQVLLWIHTSEMLYSLSIYLLLGFISHEITLRCVKPPLLSCSLSCQWALDYFQLLLLLMFLLQGCKKDARSI